MVFVDVVKDFEVRLPWIIRVGPKCNHKDPLKREAEGDLTQKEEAEMWSGRQIGEMQPQAKESWQPPEARTRFSLWAFRGRVALPPLCLGPEKLILDFCPLRVWENEFP